MRINQKLIVSYVGIGVVIALASIICVVPIGKGLKELGEFHTPALNLIQSIKTGIMGAVEESFAYVVSGEISEKEEFLAWTKEFDVQAEEFRKIANLDAPGEEKEKELFETMISDQKNLVEKAMVMLEEFETKGSVSQKVFMAYEDVVDKLDSDLSKFVEIEKEEVDEAHREAIEIINQSVRIIYIIGIFAVVLAIGIGYFISRTISNPITKLKDAAVDIAQGNMDVKIEVKPGDEIGELAEAFDNMRTSLKVVMEEYEKKEKKE